MGAIIISSGHITVVLTALFVLAGRQGGNLYAAGVAAAGLATSLCILSPPSALSCLSLVALSVGCAAFNAPAVVIRSLSAITVAVVFGGFGVQAYQTILQQNDLRAEFPLESLAARLAYEGEYDSEAAAVRLAPEIELRLQQHEHPSHMIGRRHWALERLHSERANDFVAAQGFGFERMGGAVPRRAIELPPLEPIKLPPAPYIPDNAPIPADLATSPGKEKLLTLHDTGKTDFLEPDHMGFVQADSRRAAGFQSHAFHRQPPDVEPESPWQLSRLELVSLLRHKAAVVYLSNELPRMDALADAPTRPLDAFEAFALERLRTDQDLVFSESPLRIRMLGALRAGKDCCECHSVPRGALLGAFSYELLRKIGAVAPPPPPTKPAL